MDKSTFCERRETSGENNSNKQNSHMQITARYNSGLWKQTAHWVSKWMGCSRRRSCWAPLMSSKKLWGIWLHQPACYWRIEKHLPGLMRHSWYWNMDRRRWNVVPCVDSFKLQRRKTSDKKYYTYIFFFPGGIKSYDPSFDMPPFLFFLKVDRPVGRKHILIPATM